METRVIGKAELYFLTYPLRSMDGDLVGYLQAARYVPDIEGRVVQILWIAGVTLLALLVGLLVSLYVRAGKLLEPLHAIAQTADRVSARELDVRLPADPEMDLESHVLSQSFNRLLDRLDASFADMRRFTSNASHQLQTPLTVMKGHVDVTLRKERDVRAYRETLKILQGEIREMIRMVRALLTLSRLEHATKGEPFESVELSAVLDPIRMRHIADADRLDIRTSDALCVLGNREWMQMILENLVDNALKYAPEGRVVLRAEKASDEVVIMVEDSGPGLPEEDREHLSERFFRGSNARDQGVKGHGLGLALVDRLVALQNGQWKLESDASGTRVVLQLPAC
jgi:signal transduction histidine kinase